MNRIIAHLDMDAFYASAELVRRPSLRGLPVAIGGRKSVRPMRGESLIKLGQYKGRGVLTTANYEARALGLHSAMPIMKAAKLAPDVILLPADFEWYKHLSRCFKRAVSDLADKIEDVGIDEIYLDLSKQVGGSFDVAVELANKLKTAVVESTGGMTCSIGLSANKLTSKIASDLDKPNGLSIVRPEEFERIIWPLSVAKIKGIGPKAQAKLAELEVFSVADLAVVERNVLTSLFGMSFGSWLADSARGIDNKSLNICRQPKTLSRETTFERDLSVLRDRKELSKVLEILCLKLENDLAKKKVNARTIGVKVRFSDFSICTREYTAGKLMWKFKDLITASRAALKKVPFENSNRPSCIRLLGVKASGLVHSSSNTQQLELFG